MSQLHQLFAINEIGKLYNGSLEVCHDKHGDRINGVDAFTATFTYSDQSVSETAKGRFLFEDNDQIAHAADDVTRWLKRNLEHVVMNPRELEAICAFSEARIMHFKG